MSAVSIYVQRVCMGELYMSCIPRGSFSSPLLWRERESERRLADGRGSPLSRPIRQRSLSLSLSSTHGGRFRLSTAKGEARLGEQAKQRWTHEKIGFGNVGRSRRPGRTSEIPAPQDMSLE